MKDDATEVSAPVEFSAAHTRLKHRSATRKCERAKSAVASSNASFIRADTVR